MYLSYGLALRLQEFFSISIRKHQNQKYFYIYNASLPGNFVNKCNSSFGLNEVQAVQVPASSLDSAGPADARRSAATSLTPQPSDAAFNNRKRHHSTHPPNRLRRASPNIPSPAHWRALPFRVCCARDAPRRARAVTGLGEPRLRRPEYVLRKPEPRHPA